MSTLETVERDERTVAVENTSYRYAYLVLTYALLADVGWRSFVRHEAAWDLMALVIVGGVVGTLYQASQKVLSRSWVKTALLAAFAAGMVAAILAMAS
jgi:hypothetical protein